MAAKILHYTQSLCTFYPKGNVDSSVTFDGRKDTKTFFEKRKRILVTYLMHDCSCIDFNLSDACPL